MIVETQFLGRKDAELLHLQLPAEDRSLRDLLVLLVHHELTAYEQRRAASNILRVLTPADLARGVDTGSYGRETRHVPAAPSEGEAIARAVEAFADGLFFVFVDGEQVKVLDTPISVGPDTTLRLLRLVALAGG